ncbi:Arylsulfatase A [Rubritalea squalenifaciens DSM 18772]|uniref:Arylsulfatase A n=1 Tax=Rubritalea squalenifaciens DSM 18772 TaxID=1123071 RepID=A0A1M6QEW4_9BACT|nr:arylsulfatase [Rubritalea squalenifaciens]SHK18718.1 Arylsulfatase A [Rubritalea squalenifaciens DSM 18772]
MGSRVGAVLAAAMVSVAAQAAEKPNIIVILADDMGVDSVAELNEKLGIKTPHLDKMVKGGISFGDAHSGSAVCTPTRYGVLTGRYAWRSRLKSGIVGKWERPLIEEGRLTLPGMLKEQGYDTACIGKWHLGWNWPKKGGGYTQKQGEIDFTGTIEGGAMGCGFDYYFGDDVPNWPPFVWIENGKMSGVPDTNLKFAAHYGSNNGIGLKGWKLEDVLPEITRRSVKYIDEKAKTDDPFFLYFPMTSPHTPIAPSEQFKGKSGISAYADFLMETDWCVGQVLEAVERNGISENTLVIFTTDNGTSPKAKFEELREKGVELQEHWRGYKADAFEGGHRVPFIAVWPGVIKPGAKSEQTISLVDIMATCADATDYKLPETAAEDSVSLLEVFKDPSVTKPLHEAVICHSITGQFVVRKGRWKILFCPGSGGWSAPKDAQAKKQGLPDWQLYDLVKDPKEINNLVNTNPEVVAELKGILKKYVEQGRSTPGAAQPNHNQQNWWPQLPWQKGE